MGKSVRGWRSKLLLVAGGLFVALLLAEVAVRVFWSKLTPPADAVTEYPFGEKPFPGRGFFPIPNSTYETRYDGDPYDQLPEGEVVRYTLNEAGFRERPFAAGGAEGSPLVAVLGDSFVFGEGVEQHRTMTVVAESVLKASLGARARVLNLGVPGYASEDERDLARFILPEVSPRVVIIGYCLNDPVHWEDERRVGWSGVDLVVRRDKFIHREREGGSPFFLVRFVERVLDERRLTAQTVAWYHWMYEGEDAPWLETRDYIIEIRDEARRGGAETGLLLFPIFYRLGEDYPFAAIHRQIVSWCEEVGIPVLDTLPLFEGRETESLVVHPKDHHPNAEAHSILGLALAEFVGSILEAEER